MLLQEMPIAPGAIGDADAARMRVKSLDMRNLAFPPNMEKNRA
jgi:hypothetical protein